jgi:hypothetical protein
MHQLAEFGVAAHWDYKLNSSSSSSSSAHENVTNTGDTQQAPKLTLSTIEKVFPSTEVELVVTDPIFTPSSNDDCCGSVIVLSSSPRDDDSDYARTSTTSASANFASGPYVTAIIHAKEMLNNQVYVFVMDDLDQSSEDHGELISVPVGSRVVDAISKSVNVSSPSTVKVWRNDLPTKLDDTIQNGDVLMISL